MYIVIELFCGVNFCASISYVCTSYANVFIIIGTMYYTKYIDLGVEFV